jgi:4-hydroxy-tetrahydrodipicolinate synthase
MAKIARLQGQFMKSIRGSIVALITPMHSDGSVDYGAVRRLIDWHIEQGTSCIAVVGTTGESPTVSIQEHCEIIKVAVLQAGGRIPIMAGTGANSTREAIELSRFAQDAGADCSLSVVPYYNKPSQDGIYAHFEAIAQACSLPMVIYNVPGRTVVDMQVSTVMRLASLPSIVGIKEASGDIERSCWLLKEVPKNFSVYSGDDATAVALMLLGGHGNISVTANVAPRLMHQLCMAAMARDAVAATQLHMKLLGLHKNLFIEPSPAPVKWAMAQRGLCGDTLRLPLTPLTQQGQRLLNAALQDAGF